LQIFVSIEVKFNVTPKSAIKFLGHVSAIILSFASTSFLFLWKVLKLGSVSVNP